MQQLKDEVRRSQACELLLRTDWPMARVARAAGFASDKSFARAFRQWTGQTPQGWRQQGVSEQKPAPAPD